MHGGRLAAGSLADGGRTHLATISGPRDMTVALDREEGFRAELAARGLGPGVAVEGDFSMEGGRRAMAALLAAPERIDGVFAASDLMALGAFQAIADAGLRVPEDIAVVGFDDMPLAATVRPGADDRAPARGRDGRGAGHPPPARDRGRRTGRHRPGADRAGPPRQRLTARAHRRRPPRHSATRPRHLAPPPDAPLRRRARCGLADAPTPDRRRPAR